jgi:hypothetical protein
MSSVDFTDIAEPEPDRFAGRFVILMHDHPFVHWDLMLEADGVLRTWRLLAAPAADRIIGAEALPDHRLHYLEYEGPVSGGRGKVIRWDGGRHETRQTPQETIATIASDRLGSGRIELTRSADEDRWTFVFHPHG